MVIPSLIFEETILFSSAAASFYIPQQQSTRVLISPTQCQLLLSLDLFVSLFNNRKSKGHEVVFYCGLACISIMIILLASFHVLIRHLYIIFGELFIQVLCPFVSLFGFLVAAELQSYIFWRLTPYQIYNLHSWNKSHLVLLSIIFFFFTFCQKQFVSVLLKICDFISRFFLFCDCFLILLSFFFSSTSVIGLIIFILQNELAKFPSPLFSKSYLG